MSADSSAAGIDFPFDFQSVAGCQRRTARRQKEDFKRPSLSPISYLRGVTVLSHLMAEDVEIHFD